MPASEKATIEAHPNRCEEWRCFVEGARNSEYTLAAATIWESLDQRAKDQHLDSRDMLFALAKAGGGVHLEQCEPCRQEAELIENSVKDFEAQKTNTISPQLRQRLLAMAPMKVELAPQLFEA